MPVALDGLGNGHQQAPILHTADEGIHLVAVAAAPQPDFLAHIGLPVRPRIGRRYLGGCRSAMGQLRHHPVIGLPEHAAEGAAVNGRRQRLSADCTPGARPYAAIGYQSTVRAIKFGSGVWRRICQSAKQRPRQVRQQNRIIGIGDTHRGLAKCTRIDAGLLSQSGDLGFQQPVLILVQIEQ